MFTAFLTKAREDWVHFPFMWVQSRGSVQISFLYSFKAAERPLCCSCFSRGHQASLPQSHPPQLSTLPGTLWARFSVKPKIQDVHGHLKDAPKHQEAWGSSSRAAQPLAVVLRGCCAACEGLQRATSAGRAHGGTASLPPPQHFPPRAKF